MTRNAFLVMCFAPAWDRPFVSCLVCHETLLSPHVTKHSYDSCLALLTGVGLWLSGVGLVRLGRWPVGGGNISSPLPYDSFPWHVGRWQGGGIGAVCGGAPSGVLLGPFLARAKYIAPLNLQRSKVVRVKA